MKNPRAKASSSMDHPVAILIRGLPGSGKSYLAARLQAAIGEDTVVMLDPDAIDYASPEYLEHTKSQAAEGVDAALHAYRFSRAKAYRGIEDHKVIIWNQPFTNLEIFQKMIDRLETHAAEHGTTLPILVVEITIDPATASARIAARKQAGGHGPSEATFSRFVHEYTSAASLGYDIVSIHGYDDIDASVAAIMSHISQLA